MGPVVGLALSGSRFGLFFDLTIYLFFLCGHRTDVPTSVVFLFALPKRNRKRQPFGWAQLWAWQFFY